MPPEQPEEVRTEEPAGLESRLLSAAEVVEEMTSALVMSLVAKRKFVSAGNILHAGLRFSTELRAAESDWTRVE